MDKNKKIILTVIIVILIILLTIFVFSSLNNNKEKKVNNKTTTDIYEVINNGGIYQETYKINQYNDTTSQVRQYMDEFEMTCTSYLGIEIDNNKEGILSGESKSKLPVPVEESIYLEERTYTKTYVVENELEEKTQYYDIKFYKSGENLVAEFIKD